MASYANEDTEQRRARLAQAKAAMLGELSEVIDVDISEVGIAIRAFYRTRARKAAAIAEKAAESRRGRFRDQDHEMEH